MKRILLLLAGFAPGVFCQVDVVTNPVVPQLWDDAVMKDL